MAKEMVKVLVSKGFGAGWSTWFYGEPEDKQKLAQDPQLVKMIEDGESEEDVEKYINDMLGNEYFYMGGFHDLVIEEVEKGTAYRITEYDGSETLEEIYLIDHFIA